MWMLYLSYYDNYGLFVIINLNFKIKKKQSGIKKRR